MSEIPPTPNPFPHPTPPSPPPTPPTETPLIPEWVYSLNVLLLIAGIIVALVAVYLTYKSLTKRVENNSDKETNKTNDVTSSNRARACYDVQVAMACRALRKRKLLSP
jgi:hypothetical protein